MTSMQNQQMIKDMKVLLKDMEPFVKRLDPLHHGRKISNFSLLPREAWANWLLCAVLRKIHDDDITFAEDDAGDGIIVDKKTGKLVPTEHVSALDIPLGTKFPQGDDRITNAIERKIKKGPDYAQGKLLVVFFDGAGNWIRKNVREAINGKHNFQAIYCIGLESSGSSGYVYTLTEFNPNTPETSTTFKVKINYEFTEWEVVRLVDQRDGVIEVAI